MWRLQAALGGNPSRLGQVHAFLRVKNQDVSTALDFDSPTGTDTSWQRIFCCLRSGFIAEAVEVRSVPQQLQHTNLLYSGSLPRLSTATVVANFFRPRHESALQVKASTKQFYDALTDDALTLGAIPSPACR